MHSIRMPAVAGTFYPDDPAALKTQLDAFHPSVPGLSSHAPKAVIAPHAGYIYSGPIASSVYAHLAVGRDSIRQVILLGPAHRVAFNGLAVSTAEYFRTPLGDVPIDTTCRDQLCALGLVQLRDDVHVLEHSLEVQLPFLQTTLRDFTLLPIVVGSAASETVAQVIEQLWDGDQTVFVISSDLSHYHDYATAQRLDATTAAAIERLQEQSINHNAACGAVPIRGLLRAARSHQLRARTVDLRNSGDTAGEKSRVVGYGGFIFA